MVTGPAEGPKKGDWTFLTNHAHVLVCIFRDPNIRTRDIAAMVGITERATQSIVNDLVGEGYLERTREGRRNVYRVITTARLRHPLEAHREVGELLTLLEQPVRAASGAGRGGKR